jgi:hypothetical protein
MLLKRENINGGILVVGTLVNQLRMWKKVTLLVQLETT